MLARLLNCKNYMQKLCTVYILGSLLATSVSQAQNYRKPASFVPDDDLIIVPIIIEKNFIDDFHEKHKREFDSAKKTLTHWISQEQYAKDYGLEDAGIVALPTNEQKEQFLHKHYLRFISKDLETASNQTISNTWNEWTADDEIDSIKAMEMHEKVLVHAENGQAKKNLKATSKVEVGKSSFKFNYELHPLAGMAKVSLKAGYFNARAWLGANGKQELKVDRYFASTKTSAFANYYIDETKILAAVDQVLAKSWSLRYTHSKDFEDFEDMTKHSPSEDNILQVRFHMRF